MVAEERVHYADAFLRIIQNNEIPYYIDLWDHISSADGVAFDGVAFQKLVNGLHADVAKHLSELFSCNHIRVFKKHGFVSGLSFHRYSLYFPARYI